MQDVVLTEEKTLTGVDLKLGRGNVVHGRVTVGDPPQPAAGLAVTLVAEMRDAAVGGGMATRSLRHAPVRFADTDLDGRYTFRVPSGIYHLMRPHVPPSTAGKLRTRVQEGQDFGNAQLFMLRDAGEIERDFHFSRSPLGRHGIRGIVRSNEPHGPPIARAIVIASSLDLRDDFATTFADEEGKFTLPRPLGRALISARDSTGRLAGFAVSSVGNLSEVAVVARPAANAYGRVVDRAGLPFGNARVACSVSLDSADPEAAASSTVIQVTDNRGGFKVPGLFVGARCTLYAIHPGGHGHSPSKSFDVKDAQPIDVGEVVLHPR